jgi:hypothetical protein
LFGKNPFGETIKKNLYYTKRPLCNGQVPSTPEYIKVDGYFLLVDRGGCSFVEKIRNAEKDNATAVLIADNTCLCSVDGSCEADEECEDIEPTMDDDGTGVDIKIPSLLLFKPDADILRQELMSGTMIEMSLSFPVPQAVDGRTEYMLWTTPDDSMSYQFLNTFFEAAFGFGDLAVFQPRMLIKDGSEKGCRQYDNSNIPCKGYCTNYGRYCEPQSFYDTNSYDNIGARMVVESLRRACIWEVYGNNDGIGREWWSYAQMWMLECSYSHYSTNCAEQLYSLAGVEKDKVESCMISSGDFRTDVTNDLLERSLIDAANYHVSWAPKLLVNGALIQGSLTFGTAIEAICASFDVGDKPEICDKWKECAASCPSGNQCVLWGNGEECAEYRAPYLSNENQQYDDDLLFANATSTPTAMTVHPTTAPTLASTIATSDPTSAPTVTTASSSQPTGETFGDEPVELPVMAPMFLPTSISALHDTPQPSNAPVFQPSGNPSNLVPPSRPKQSGENQEVVETIQIYEGGNGLAIGLGTGIGCMALIVGFLLLISRDRRSRKRLEELEAIASQNMSMSASLPRGDWSQCSRSHYSDRRPPPGGSHYIAEDYFEDEDEDEFYFEPHYGPPPSPRRGRLRFFPPRRVGPPQRSFRGRFVRRQPSTTIDDEDQEIEELVAQHFQDQQCRQQHKVDLAQRTYLGECMDHEMEQNDVDVATIKSTNSTRRSNKPMKQSLKKSITNVIQLEEAASVMSSTRRSERSGSW